LTNAVGGAGIVTPPVILLALKVGNIKMEELTMNEVDMVSGGMRPMWVVAGTRLSVKD
jgi:hypothetical protein